MDDKIDCIEDKENNVKVMDAFDELLTHLEEKGFEFESLVFSIKLKNEPPFAYYRGDQIEYTALAGNTYKELCDRIMNRIGIGRAN